MSIWIDYFCGAGGASTGITAAGGKVAIAINHDPKAIQTHTQNHPSTMHMIEDIAKLDPLTIAALTAKMQEVNIWASVDCTHHSIAKGGQSRNGDSRMLAEDMVPHVAAIRPHMFILENVREFMGWGPIAPRGMEGFEVRRFCALQVEIMQAKSHNEQALAAELSAELQDLYEEITQGHDPVLMPYKPMRGTMFNLWVDHVRGLGYDYDSRLINAADYGAPQTRVRYFGIFKRKGSTPICWPKPTHHKDGIGLPKWRAASEILDLDNLGADILQAKGKPLCKATLQRIKAGLNAYGPQPMIVRSDTGSKPIPTSMPLPTVKATWESGLVRMINTNTYNNKPHRVDAPLPTVMANRDHNLATFVVNQYGTSTATGIDRPLGAVTTNPKSLLCTAFICKYFGSTIMPRPITEPLGTVTTKDRAALVTSYTITHHGGPQAHTRHRPVSQPLNVVSTQNSPTLITAKTSSKPFKYYIGHAEEALTASGSIAHPTWLKIAGAYLVSANIEALHYRMLTVPEISAAQTFPEDYKFLGNATKDKKFVGNAVACVVAEAIVKSNS